MLATIKLTKLKLNIKFVKLDIRIDKLPVSDLMICRDCLFHFSYEDIFKFLDNFLISDIKYILLTSHLNTENKFENKNIVTGDFRKIDLFSKPFNFEKNYIYSFVDRDVFEIQHFMIRILSEIFYLNYTSSHLQLHS